MKIAFLYAGQGSQAVGMGKDFYNEYETFRNIFDEANNALSFDLKQLCFEGPMEKLSQTSYTQPCMVSFAAGVTQLLKENNIVPNAVAGLSLGEYSALYASGVFSLNQAITTVALRGNVMDKACQNTPCGMAAVLGLDREKLQEACNEASELGIISIANYNCPGQLVIGGEAKALEKASELAKLAGAKRVLPLAVSGAFHTKLMANAAVALQEHFENMQMGKMEIPVYFNSLGNEKDENETIASLLVKQVQSSVYFEDTLLAMQKNGIDTIVEIGPGKALSGFVRKTCKEMKVYSIENVEQLKQVVAQLSGTGE